jgi:transcriptional regulator with XRE-family HTH domain
MYRIREIPYGQTKYPKHPTLIKKVLKEKKITQRKLADGTGIARSTISEIVSGQQVDMLMRTAKNIANFLGCSLEEIFGEQK